MTGQGFSNAAIVLLRSMNRYFAGRAVEKEAIVEGTTIKTQRFLFEELAPRFSDYAKVLTLIANAYGKKGNLISGDSAFKAAHKPGLEKTSVLWVKNNAYPGAK